MHFLNYFCWCIQLENHKLSHKSLEDCAVAKTKNVITQVCMTLNCLMTLVGKWTGLQAFKSAIESSSFPCLQNNLLKKWAGVAYASRLFPFTSILLEHSNPYFFLLRCRPKSRSFMRGLARNCESRLAPNLHTFLKSRIYDSENPGNRGNPTYNFVPNPHARTPRELTHLLILSLRQGECCTELKLTT